MRFKLQSKVASNKLICSIKIYIVGHGLCFPSKSGPRSRWRAGPVFLIVLICSELAARHALVRRIIAGAFRGLLISLSPPSSSSSLYTHDLKHQNFINFCLIPARNLSHCSPPTSNKLIAECFGRSQGEITTSVVNLGGYLGAPNTYPGLAMQPCL